MTSGRVENAADDVAGVFDSSLPLGGGAARGSAHHLIAALRTVLAVAALAVARLVLACAGDSGEGAFGARAEVAVRRGPPLVALARGEVGVGGVRFTHALPQARAWPILLATSVNAFRTLVS